VFSFLSHASSPFILTEERPSPFSAEAAHDKQGMGLRNLAWSLRWWLRNRGILSYQEASDFSEKQVIERYITRFVGCRALPEAISLTECRASREEWMEKVKERKS
jgi:hypothetical protein